MTSGLLINCWLTNILHFFRIIIIFRRYKEFNACKCKWITKFTHEYNPGPINKKDLVHKNQLLKGEGCA